MRSSEIVTGSKYLTRTITVTGHLGGPMKTRGLVEVTGQVNAAGLRDVRWLNRDGLERVDSKGALSSLPKRLPARDFLVEVKA